MCDVVSDTVVSQKIIMLLSSLDLSKQKEGRTGSQVSYGTVWAKVWSRTWTGGVRSKDWAAG